MPFQIHYDNVVLDTLHNYFPAMLYEPEAFPTLPDVFAYTRAQMQRHFDLFSTARDAYRQAAEPPPRAAAAAPEANIFHASIDLLNMIRPRASANFTNIIPAPSIHMQDILNMLMTAPRPAAAAAAFDDPVIVRPTEEHIGAATTLETSSTDDEICAICQDTIPLHAQMRSINACDHQFHVLCIDTWFQQNVRCPVCRHDIRERA
jgi:hypothetical protein